VDELTDNWTEISSIDSSHPIGEGVVIDIGTGDGHFVYQSAKSNPRKFYIGIDANPRPLEKVSERIHRNPRKGGLPNVLFVQAAVEDLPDELDGVADEVHVHFPWGSLLAAVVNGDPAVLGNLRRICASGALLEVILALDPERDRTEIERLQLQPLSVDHIDSTLAPRYRAAGFDIVDRRVLTPAEAAELNTAWAKRLTSKSGRTVLCIVARATP
jgi:16S rRNA (adenine(1408)-N(1))-methyltransferase